MNYRAHISVFGGRYETLSEITYALQLDKPVIGLETWDINGVQKMSTDSEAIEKLHHKFL